MLLFKFMGFFEVKIVHMVCWLLQCSHTLKGCHLCCESLLLIISCIVSHSIKRPDFAKRNVLDLKMHFCSLLCWMAEITFLQNKIKRNQGWSLRKALLPKPQVGVWEETLRSLRIGILYAIGLWLWKVTWSFFQSLLHIF